MHFFNHSFCTLGCGRCWRPSLASFHVRPVACLGTFHWPITATGFYQADVSNITRKTLVKRYIPLVRSKDWLFAVMNLHLLLLLNGKLCFEAFYSQYSYIFLNLSFTSLKFRALLWSLFSTHEIRSLRVSISSHWRTHSRSHTLASGRSRRGNKIWALKISRYILITFLLDGRLLFPQLRRRVLHRRVFHSHGAPCPRGTLPFWGNEKAHPTKVLKRLSPDFFFLKVERQTLQSSAVLGKQHRPEEQSIASRLRLGGGFAVPVCWGNGFLKVSPRRKPKIIRTPVAKNLRNGADTTLPLSARGQQCDF